MEPCYGIARGEPARIRSAVTTLEEFQIDSLRFIKRPLTCRQDKNHPSAAFASCLQPDIRSERYEGTALLADCIQRAARE